VARDRNHNNSFGPFDLKIGRPWIKIHGYYNFVYFTGMWNLVSHFEWRTKGEGGWKWDVKENILV